MELARSKMVTTSCLLLVSVVTCGAGGGSGAVHGVDINLLFYIAK